MSDERLSDRDKGSTKGPDLPHELGRERTETIDLASLFTSDVSTTGSFDIRGKIWATTFGKLLQALPIPVFLIDTGHRVIQANQACVKISPEYQAMLGAPFCDFFSSSRSYETVRSTLEEIFATRKTRVVEAVLSIGERRAWTRITFRSLRIGEDRVVLALIEDLTNEKIQIQTIERLRQDLERRVEERTVRLSQANESLKQVEQRYRTLFEEAPIMYVITKNERGVPYITDCNQFFLSSVGYSREEVVGQSMENFYSAESIAELLGGGGYKRALAGENIIGERQLLTRNGSQIPTLLYTTPEEDPSGQVIGTRAMFADITDLKKAQEAQRESEERYRILAENSLTGIFVHQDGKFVYINGRAAENLGYSPSELIGKSVWELVAPEDLEMTRHIVAARLQGEEAPSHYQFRVLTRNGDIRWLEALATEIEHDGRPATLATVMDITYRKHAEEVLRASEEKFRTVADWTYDWEYWLDPNGHVVYMSPSCERLTGYAPKEFIEDPDLLMRIIHPEDRSAYEEHYGSIQAANESTAAGPREFRIIARDGSEHWIDHVCRAVFTLEGRHLGIRVSNREITLRKKAEENLRESEETFRSVFENSRDGILFTAPDGRIYEANQAACQMLGRSDREICEIGRDKVVDLTDPRLVPALEDRARTGSFKGELNFKRQDGTTFPVEISSSAYRDAKGNLRTSIIFRDITERKRLEAESEKLVLDLTEALTQVKKLSGLLPICASCKKIRDDKGNWTQMEAYIRNHSEAEFSHGICPECARKLYPELYGKEPT